VVERLLAHGYTDIRCNVRQRADIPKLNALLGAAMRKISP